MLLGTFSTENDPKLNNKLKQLKKLEIGFHESQSNLFIQSEKFNLSLDELRINGT
jgi:hypothetical protein